MEIPPKKKLLDQVRDAIRLKHYSYRTEESYVQWIRHTLEYWRIHLVIQNENQSSYLAGRRCMVCLRIRSIWMSHLGRKP